MERNMMKRSSLMLLVAMIALMMSCGISFADETGSTVTVKITAGEHGSVNGKTGNFTEAIASGGNLTLSCKADEGYVIHSIIVNDAEVEEADLDGILHQGSGSLTLEELTTGLSVTVGFAEEGAAASAETGTMDEETDSADTSAETDDLSVSDVGDVDLSDAGTENGDETGDDLETETMSTDDEPGSLSTGEDPDAEVDLDDEGQSGGEETQPGTTETDTSDAESDSEEAAEQPSDDGTKEDKTEEDSEKTSSETEKDGKGNVKDSDSEDDSDNEDASYVSDSSPKTGDTFPMPVIFAMLSSLCALAGIGVRQFLKKRTQEA